MYMNAIPSKAFAEIAISKDDVFAFQKDFLAYCETVRQQNLPEENMTFEVQLLRGETIEALDQSSTDNILSLLKLLPHGPIKMIPTKPDLVETSTNLGDIEIQGDQVIIKSSNRSSDDESMETLKKIQKNIGSIFGFGVSYGDKYPSWQPYEDSKLLSLAKEVYADLYGNEFKSTVIHAGLECSYIVDKYGKTKECISIGPTIKNPHTGAERLQASTVVDFYNAVANLLIKIFAK
ncbi:Uncharacterised protein [uncultured archaeon]|nr:Uncharacterised protein [uncultured archaeon]